MSDSSNETGHESSALMDADILYKSDLPDEEATEAGESPEVDEDVEVEADAETETDAETEAKPDGDETVDSTLYQFDEEAGEYTFKAGGKEIKANTDKLIEYAQKGVGFEKNLARTKSNDEQRKSEHNQALEAVQIRENELQSLVESVESLLQEEQVSDELLDDDPAEYIRQEKRVKERREKLDQAKAALNEKRQAEIQSKADREYQELVKAKGWETNEDAEKGFKPISDYMKGEGISMAEIYPHKVYLALEKAAKYDALQAKKQETIKQVKRAPKSVKAQKSTSKQKEKSAVDVLYG